MFPSTLSLRVILTLAYRVAAVDDDEQTANAFVPELRPLAPPSTTWATLPANRNYGLFDRPAAALPGFKEHEGFVKRQSTPAPLTASPSGGDGEESVENPTLQATYNTELLASISALDSIFNAEISSLVQDITTAQCLAATDVSGTQTVTICGPSEASAPSPTGTKNVAACTAKALEGAVMVGLLGALAL